MDRQDGRLRVVGPRQHQLELELIQRRAQAPHAFDDVLVEAVIFVLGGQFEHHAEVFRLARQFLGAGDDSGEIGSLADQLLSAAIVLPEARRAHLGLESGEACFLGRDVKDASGARPRAG